MKSGTKPYGGKFKKIKFNNLLYIFDLNYRSCL